MHQEKDGRIRIQGSADGSIIVSGDKNSINIYHYAHEIASPQTSEPKQGKIGLNPYVGLQTFNEGDADRFYGREKFTQHLWTKINDIINSKHNLTKHPYILPIIGPSGSGKSSVARAGLIPELVRNPIPGFSNSRILIMKPGQRPIETLANVLVKASTKNSIPLGRAREFSESLYKQDSQGNFDGLWRIIQLLPEINSRPLIILIDQFEELYSICEDKKHQHIFIENLLQAASANSANTFFILTLRSDYLEETQGHQVFNNVLANLSEIVPIMSEIELRSAITQPAIAAGNPLDISIVDLLVCQTKDRVGALPLLQIALTSIWEGIMEGVNPSEKLARIGGVGGALAAEAQYLYESLSEDGRDIARRAFLSMVQIGKDAKATRRRVKVSTLVAIGEKREFVREVLDQFSQKEVRLITHLASSDENNTEIVEITHETLLDNWDSLKNWIEEDRDDIKFIRRLDEAATNWIESNRKNGLLWTSINLNELRETTVNKPQYINSLHQEFYKASLKLRKLRIVYIIVIFLLPFFLFSYLANSLTELSFEAGVHPELISAFEYGAESSRKLRWIKKDKLLSHITFWANSSTTSQFWIKQGSNPQGINSFPKDQYWSYQALQIYDSAKNLLWQELGNEQFSQILDSVDFVKIMKEGWNGVILDRSQRNQYLAFHKKGNSGKELYFVLIAKVHKSEVEESERLFGVWQYYITLGLSSTDIPTRLLYIFLILGGTFILFIIALSLWFSKFI